MNQAPPVIRIFSMISVNLLSWNAGQNAGPMVSVYRLCSLEGGVPSPME